MKKTISIIAVLLGVSTALNAQASEKGLLINQIGQQFEISNATVYLGEELNINPQGMVTRRNGEFVGYAAKTGPYVPETPETPYNSGAATTVKGSLISIN